MPLTTSDADVVLLHNPRCSKSRAAKALLDDRGVVHRVRRYLEEPLDAAELEELRARLGRPVGEWVRPKEAPAREAGIGPEASDAEWIALLARAPIAMERPILVTADRARVGRPPEQILELLE